jgi:Rrf2 family iron-sulfur cluster assembly transcriptional regulator
MKLGTKGRYAVMALVDLAHRGDGQPVALVEIAEQQNLSLQYLEQLFGRLRKAGIVCSVRGSQGGYLLARPAGEIRILDIMKAAEESLKSTRCNRDHEKGCINGIRPCSTHNLWAGLEKVISDYFRSISLADITEQGVTV